MENKVKRTERGWPGHFILAKRCVFRRNTLLEYGDKKVVVSSVGALMTDGKMDTVGSNRWYETMVFKGQQVGEYIEADTSFESQLNVDGDWGLWAKSEEELFEKYGDGIDNVANDMHERIVDEFIQKLEGGAV